MTAPLPDAPRAASTTGPLLSIVIVSWNVAPLLAACLRSLPAAAAGCPCEVIVVDNDSPDESAALVARDFPAVRLIRNPTNAGYARANNQGLAVSAGAYALLLNSDTVAPPGALAALVAFMAGHPEAGAAGPRLVGADGRPQPYAFGGDPTPAYLLRRGLNRFLRHRPLHDWATTVVRPVDWVSGACLLVRRQAIAQVGLLDENIFMYFEDSDWCLRLRRAGWQVYHDPEVAIVHLGGQSIARNPAARQAYYQSLVYFYGKHYGPLARRLLLAALPAYRRLAGY